MRKKPNPFSNAMRLLRIYYHYRRRSIDLPYMPIFAGIETTGLCNLRCTMCPHGQEKYRSRKRGHMSFDVFKRVVDEAKDFIYDADLFGGGESLLHPQIFEMISYANKAGMYTRLHTNATMLDEKRAEGILSSGLDYLSFSFEGYSKEAYENLRVNAVYEDTLNNIYHFLDAKARSGQRKPYTVLQVLKPPPDELTDQIVTDLERFKSSFDSYQALDEFKIIEFHNYGGKVAELDRTQNVQYSPCTFPWYAIFVLWDGSIVPCCVDWWGEFDLGNINDISLAQAWNGEKLAKLRKLLADGKYDRVQLCSECDRLWRPQRAGVPFRDLRVVKQWISHHIFGY
jgi:radical SAM protein with 4Fe4S-binding SPASM domain